MILDCPTTWTSEKGNQGGGQERKGLGGGLHTPRGSANLYYFDLPSVCGGKLGGSGCIQPEGA